MNAGIDSEKRSKSMSFIGVIINNPTNISTGAVAADGIAKNSGENNNDTAKQIATVKAVRPVLPP